MNKQLFGASHRHSYTAPNSKDWHKNLAKKNNKYFKEVISNFCHKTKPSYGFDNGRQIAYAQCEDLHYCWLGIDFNFNRKNIVEVSAYTGRSGNIASRLSDPRHFSRSNKILIYTSKNISDSISQLKGDYIPTAWKDSSPREEMYRVVEQANINAIRKLESFECLNRKMEAGHNECNPVLLNKLQQVEKYVAELNTKLLKLRKFYDSGKIQPENEFGQERLKLLIQKKINYWFDNLSEQQIKDRIKLDKFERPVFQIATNDYAPCNPPNVSLAENDGKDVAEKEALSLLREIHKCEIFNEPELGLGYTFGYSFREVRGGHHNHDQELKNFFSKIASIEKGEINRIKGHRAEKNQNRNKIKSIMAFNQAREKRLKILRNQYVKLAAAMRRTNWEEGRKVKCAINPKNYNPKKPEETYVLDYFHGSKLIWLSELECIKRGEEIIEKASSIKNHHIDKPWSKQDIEDPDRGLCCDTWCRRSTAGTAPSHLEHRGEFGELIEGYQVEKDGNVELDLVEDQYYQNVAGGPDEIKAHRRSGWGARNWDSKPSLL